MDGLDAKRRQRQCGHDPPQRPETVVHVVFCRSARVMCRRRSIRRHCVREAAAQRLSDATVCGVSGSWARATRHYETPRRTAGKIFHGRPSADGENLSRKTLRRQRGNLATKTHCPRRRFPFGRRDNAFVACRVSMRTRSYGTRVRVPICGDPVRYTAGAPNEFCLFRTRHTPRRDVFVFFYFLFYVSVFMQNASATATKKRTRYTLLCVRARPPMCVCV